MINRHRPAAQRERANDLHRPTRYRANGAAKRASLIEPRMKISSRLAIMQTCDSER